VAKTSAKAQPAAKEAPGELLRDNQSTNRKTASSQIDRAEVQVIDVGKKLVAWSVSSGSSSC